MEIQADLDDVRMTVTCSGSALTAFLSLPFAIVLSAICLLGIGFVFLGLYGATEGLWIPLVPLVLIGSLWCVLWGPSALEAWWRVFEPFHALRVVLRQHSVRIERRLGLLPVWRLNLRFSELDAVSYTGTHLLFITPRHSLWRRVGAFEAEDLEAIVARIDRTAQGEAFDEAPEALQHLVSKGGAAP